MDQGTDPQPEGDALPVSGQPQAAGAYPVNVGAELQADYVRFLPLVKWLLLVPHYIALFFLAIGAAVVAFIAIFATLFTGTLSEGGSGTSWSGSAAGRSGCRPTCC